jgi:hypothetical protein
MKHRRSAAWRCATTGSPHDRVDPAAGRASGELSRRHHLRWCRYRRCHPAAHSARSAGSSRSRSAVNGMSSGGADSYDQFSIASKSARNAGIASAISASSSSSARHPEPPFELALERRIVEPMQRWNAGRATAARGVPRRPCAAAERREIVWPARTRSARPCCGRRTPPDRDTA